MTDQAAENARAVRALAKTGERGWIELADARIKCPQCRRGTTLARFYTGRDDTGKASCYVWVPKLVAAGRKIPPRAVPVPLDAGEVGWTQPTECERCPGTWIAFPAGPPAPPSRLAGLPSVTLYRPEGSYRDRPKPGEPTITGTFTGECLSGPARCVLLRLDSATWSHVAG